MTQTNPFVLRWFAERLPGLDDELRNEIAESVDDIADGESRRERLAELWSLLGLALTLAARRGTRDSRFESLRQGARIGALCGTYFVMASVVSTPSMVGVVLPIVLGALAIMLAGGLTYAPTVAAVIALALSVGLGDTATTIVLAVIVAGAAIGRPHDERRCPIGALAAGSGAALCAAIAVAIGPAASSATLAVAAVVVIFGLLAAGWFDPRYAVGAAFLALIRLVTTGGGVAGLGFEIAEASAATPELQYLRLLFMLLGIVASVLVAARSLRMRVGPLQPHF